MLVDSSATVMAELSDASFAGVTSKRKVFGVVERANAVPNALKVKWA